jgi:autotransporter-associated beta strand protein
MSLRRWLIALVALLLSCSTAEATQFQGTRYYTRFSGEPNVTSLGFTYDDHTHNLVYATQHDIASLIGADGIMFAPNGNLLVTSNSSGVVYRLDATAGRTLQSVSTGTAGLPDFHMALDPGRTQFYSSNRYDRTSGPLDTFGINPDGSINNATTTPITGDDPNVTQLAFAPNGKTLYVDGAPNSFGSIGLFSFAGGNDVTTQLVGTNQVRAAHGVVYDPFTGLWTMFGGGAVATMDPSAATNANIAASLKQSIQFVGDFDQGTVDGLGHAFIAGAGDITFLDYSTSHDITHADQVIIRSTDGAGNGLGGVDDVVFKQINQSPWTGVSDTGWSTPNNWIGPVPGATVGTTNGDMAIFNRSAPNSPLAVDAGRNLKNITFDTSSVNSLTIGTTGGNALLLSAGGTIQTTSTVVNPQVINCPLILEGDYALTSGASSSAATLRLGGRITPGATSGVTTLSLSGTNVGNNTIGGILPDNGAGTLALTKSGAGVWIISGVNTFTGPTTVSAGTLVLGNSAAAQNTTVTISSDNGLEFAAGLGSATVGGLAGTGKLALQDKATTPAAVNLTAGGDGDSTMFTGVISGAGSILKTGTGTLTLTAANTYTGGTTISTGAIVLGNSNAAQNSTITVNTDNGLAFTAALSSATFGGLSGSGNFALQDQAASPAAVNITVGGNSASTSYGGVMSGTGGVTKVGTGTLSLLGVNTYTGLTTINAGVLQLGDGATTNGSIAGNIGDNATLAFANPNAQSYSGVISGSGGVTKSGAGMLALGGASTYAGGTTVNSGGLQIAGPTTISDGNIASSPIGKGTLTLATGTTLQDDGAARTLASNLVINGNITFASTGAGNLTISPTGLTNATNVVLHNNPAFNVTNITTIKSIIDGPGQSLTKSGAGILILGGANDYRGGTTINAGTLTVNAGGSLGGGPLTITAASGTHPMLNVSASQAVSSVTANASGMGSTTINLASTGTTLTSTGSLTASGTFNVNGGGTLEIQSPPTIAANGHIFVNNDTMRFSATTGTATIGTGVVATVNVGSTLELAGSVSALSSATNRANITTVATSNGVLVSGTNQRVGQINGAGSVVVNSGSDLTADHIVQSALVIQGSAGRPAVVTIAASDASGNPLSESAPNPLSALNLASPIGVAEPGPDLGAGSPANGSTSGTAGSMGFTQQPEAINGVGAAVPEPNALGLISSAAIVLLVVHVARVTLIRRRTPARQSGSASGYSRRP